MDVVEFQIGLRLDRYLLKIWRGHSTGDICFGVTM